MPLPKRACKLAERSGDRHQVLDANFDIMQLEHDDDDPERALGQVVKLGSASFAACAGTCTFVDGWASWIRLRSRRRMRGSWKRDIRSL